jgi:hypothetical protein
MMRLSTLLIIVEVPVILILIVLYVACARQKVHNYGLWRGVGPQGILEMILYMYSYVIAVERRLHMELSLKSLFGLHVT